MFVETPQVSVRTLCGRTTRKHLAGIPGVTEVHELEWCPNCARSAWAAMTSIEEREVYIVPALVPLYNAASEALVAASTKEYAERIRLADRQRRDRRKRSYKDQMKDLMASDSVEV